MNRSGKRGIIVAGVLTFILNMVIATAFEDGRFGFVFLLGGFYGVVLCVWLHWFAARRKWASVNRATDTLHELAEKALHRYGCICQLCSPVVTLRDYSVNPGGLIQYCGSDERAVLDRLERDRAEQCSAVSAPTYRQPQRDHRGFWFAELRWHSSE